MAPFSENDPLAATVSGLKGLGEGRDRGRDQDDQEPEPSGLNIGGGLPPVAFLWEALRHVLLLLFSDQGPRISPCNW
jgi:hypothetical protein